jgi:hypothetical protein
MNCADVCVEMDYDGSNEFYNEATRTAAKPHQCCECHEVIPKGSQYEYVSGKSDGYFWTAKTCVLCAEIRIAFCCGSWQFGRLWESVGDSLFRWSNTMTVIDCPAKLSEAADVKFRGKLAQYWGVCA